MLYLNVELFDNCIMNATDFVGIRANSIKFSCKSKICILGVAPRAGAWIETYTKQLIMAYSMVAPRAGAWIETVLLALDSVTKKVAPRAGAWIETHQLLHSAHIQIGRPPRGGVD